MRRHNTNQSSAFRLGELFSGPGGIGLGASLANLSAVDAGRLEHAWASDFDADTCATYAENVGHLPVVTGQPTADDDPSVYCHDIRTLDTMSLPPIDALAFGAPCFGAGTPVLTKRGAIPIEEVTEGDQVWTHKNRWRRVTTTMSRTSETVQVGPIVTTPDHPFYSRENGRRYSASARKYNRELGEPKWTPAKDTQGLYLASPLAVRSRPLNFEVDAWLAGRYLADGWTNKSGVSFAIGDKKVQEFERRIDELGIEMWTSRPSPGCVRYTWSNHAAANWLFDTFGKYSGKKTVPISVFGSSRTAREAFFAGYMSGDGYQRTRDSTRVFVTTSESMASQLRLLAISLGYVTWAYKVNPPATTVIQGRTVNQNQRWEVGVSEGRGRYTDDIDGLHWFKQRKTPKPLGKQTVYDLSVSEDHSFVAWGYVVHNCNDWSAIGERQGFGGTYGPLYSYGVAVMRSHRPKWFLFENVGGIRGDALDLVSRDFRDAGYRLYPHFYDFSDYGVPQRRRRVIIVGIRSDLDVEYRVPAAVVADVSARTALAGIADEAPNHDFARTAAMTVERLEHIKPGENAWTADLPEHLKIRTKTTISSMYRRLDPDKPSYTVTGAGGGGYHIYHFDEPRPLTNRERARLQSFPDDFTFVGGRESVRKQIGMAVPPTGAAAILSAVLKTFAGIEYPAIDATLRAAA